MGNRIRIGCIADDFTGAGDAASFLEAGGLATVLLSGIPGPKDCPDELLNGCQAVVIALKTRSAHKDQAVESSLAAARWLKERGAGQIYFKYCSTFDSTREGNIGPVVDAILEELGQRFTLLCPSLPINGRTVREGTLYVHGIPLHQSTMKDHPLNPMWAGSIPVLMREQGKYPCLVLNRAAMAGSRAMVRRQAAEYAQGKQHFYIVPDYETEEDGRRIAELFGDMDFITGGSGLLKELAGRHGGSEPQKSAAIDIRAGRTLLLAGSCSSMTLKQIRCYKQRGLPCVKILPEQVISGKMTERRIREMTGTAGSGPVLFYSSDAPEAVAAAAELGDGRIAEKLEQVMAELAVAAYRQGITNLIVAGGETSGAVIQALGFQAFRIGGSAAPGVPVLIPFKDRQARLILKSGNFGGEDFFWTAVQTIEGKGEAPNAG